MLPIDRRTLQRYEQNEQDCPDTLIPEIADAYNDPALVFRALQESPLWKSRMPQFERAPLAQATCAMLIGAMRIEGNREGIMSIAADGQVTEDETEQWTTIASTARGIIVACMQVLEAAERRVKL